MFLTSLGYSMREKPEGEVFLVNAEGVMQVSQSPLLLAGKIRKIFRILKLQTHSKLVATVFFGIGMYAMVMIAGIILAILFIALIYLILFEY